MEAAVDVRVDPGDVEVSGGSIPGAVASGT